MSLSSCNFDFLYIGESCTGTEYILILKDDFSGYVFLKPCKKADAETTSNVLMEYFSTFVPVLQPTKTAFLFCITRLCRTCQPLMESSTVSPPFTRLGLTAQ